MCVYAEFHANNASRGLHNLCGHATLDYRMKNINREFEKSKILSTILCDRIANVYIITIRICCEFYRISINYIMKNNKIQFRTDPCIR
jgi:hypothetical protein